MIGRMLFATPGDLDQVLAQGVLPSWALACFFEEAPLAVKE
jgi:hypothetical protein